MKLATYFGLVVRRVWAKKGILFGSLLGATLVIALLVVVPLYEASVQAVDLAFTIDNALEDETDVTALANQNQYSAGLAADYRDVLAEAQQQWLQPWYPTSIERSQTREFIVIPSSEDGPVDWLATAENWRDAYDQAVEEGVAESELPSAPYPQPPRDALQVRMFTTPVLEESLEIIDGAYAATGDLPFGEYAPIPLMLGERVATLTGLAVGESFFLRPFSGLPEYFEYFEVAAIVAAAEPTDAIWGFDDPNLMVYLDQAVFDEYLAVVPTSADVDPWRRTERGLPNINVTQRWRMPLAKDTVELVDVPELEDRLAQFRAQVARNTGGEVPTTSFITILLEAFTTRSVVVGGPILAMLALVVGGATYFLVYTSALAVEREGPEIALLKSRGASTWQTVGIHMGQSFVVAAIAALLAPLVARSFVSVTGRIPPLSTLTGGESLEVSQVRSVVPFMIAGGIMTFLAMGVTVIPYARRSVLSLRSLAARPGTKSIWQKYNIDIFAIALALIVLVQLRLRGFINLSGDEATLDPLAVIFPALLLFTGALVLLRLFPYVLKMVGWLFTKPRNLSIALTGWHLGRNPVPYGRLALLVWVTTGLGAFALTYAATLEQSYADRAAFTAGADVRIVGEGAGYASVPEGSLGTPVLRTDGAPRQSGRRAETLAVIPEEFGEVIIWRDDFGDIPPEELFALLRPDGVAPDVGVELSEGATTLEVEGVVTPRTLADEASGITMLSQDLTLLIKVIDADQRVWTMAASEPLTDAEWRTVTIDLTTGLNASYEHPPAPPLSISAMWVENSERTTGAAVNGEEIIFASFTAVGVGVSQGVDTREMTTINQLTVDRNSSRDEAARARYAELPEGDLPPTQEELERDPLYRTGPAISWQLPDERTRANPNVPQLWHEPADIRVLLDGEAAAISGLQVGSQSAYTVGANIVSGEMVGLIDSLPTALDPRREGVMVVDLEAVNAIENGEATWSLGGALARVVGPQELWVSTGDPDATIRAVTSQMADEPEHTYTIGGQEAAFSSRPVQVGLVAILFVGAATGVVLALAGVTGYVLLAVSRRAREMGVLRALGFERTSVGVTFALEQFVVIGIGAAIGVLGGIGLVFIMLPFFQLGETATEIVPSIELSVPSGQLVAYISIVGVLLIASVLWATRRVSVRRMSEVLREVDR